MRYLGKMGESVVSTWCAEEGLISNSSEMDFSGWDFYVEFPFPDKTSTKDSHEPALECKIQVKATDSNTRKIQITLSNLRRLATAPIPAFYLFLEFDNKNLPQAAFLLHVDNNLITKILTTIRKNEHSPTRKKINNKKMTISYSDAYQLKKMDGASMREGIMHYVGTSLTQYILNKKQHLETTGFEDGRAKLEISTLKQDSFPLFIDALLGKPVKVPIARFTATETRFGIMDKSPYLDSTHGELVVLDMQPSMKGEICFRQDPLSPSLNFKVEIYTLPYFRNLPEELRKIRIKGDFFDMTTNPFTRETKIDISFDQDFRLSFRDFKVALNLANLLTQRNSQVICEIIIDNKKAISSEFSYSNDEQLFAKEFETAKKLVKISQEFDTLNADSISIEELIKFSEEIHNFHMLITKEALQFKTILPSDEFPEDQDVACIFLIQCRLGSHVAGLIVTTFSSLKVTSSKQTTIYSSKFNIEKSIIVKKNEIIPHQDLLSMIEQIENKYIDTYYVATIFDKDLGPKA